jgi:hypothetical protein
VLQAQRHDTGVVDLRTGYLSAHQCLAQRAPNGANENIAVKHDHPPRPS